MAHPCACAPDELLVGSFDTNLYNRIVEPMLFGQIRGRKTIVAADYASVHRYPVRLIVAGSVKSFAASCRPGNRRGQF